MADYTYGLKQNTNYVITSNTLYDIGNNVRFNTLIPSQTALPINYWSRVASGGYWNSLAVASNGTLWAWGNNSFGQLGLNDLTHRSSPIQVGALNSWTQVACGYYSTLALQNNGTLWAWGRNSEGQLGINSSVNAVNSPVQVGALSNWAKIYAGFYGGYGIQSNGTLWSWGYNNNGQLGQGNTTNYSSPVQIGALSTWTSVSAFYQASYFIQNNGTLWACGYNNSGQLGLSDTTNRSSPVQVGALSVWTQVVAGAGHVLAIQNNGTLWAWGYNVNGQLGLNTTTTNFYSPVQVGALNVWTAIGAGNNISGAVQSNGTLWTWGQNSYGRLGLNTQGSSISSPIQVGTQTNWTKIAGSYNNFYGIQSPGTLWSWGSNFLGSLGYDSTTYRSYALQLGAVNQAGALNSWIGFPTGSQNTIWGAAINSNNNLYVWGTNSNRILNSNIYNNDNLGYSINAGAVIVTPVPLDPTLSTPIKSVSIGDQFGVYVQSNGTLWSWGNLSYGQVPLPITTNAAPIPIPTYMSPWTKAAGGLFSAAIQSNGTLWTWGLNSFGQLGLNTTTTISSPAQVGNLNYWSDISCGYAQTAAILSPGTLWTWGQNNAGQLGLSDTTNRSSPVQVGTLSSWASVWILSHTLAIQSNGTLWAWGNNFSGQLGQSNTTYRSSPVQIGALSAWIQAVGGSNSTYAIKNDYTLWVCGYNNYRQLGLNTSTLNFYSMVQMGSASNWSQISSNQSGSVIALQSNGTLWAWGNNSWGQLGLGDLTTRSSPVQVGNLSTWTRINASSTWTMALQSNGTLWAWGDNQYSIQGNNSFFNNSSSPVQVGSLTSWVGLAKQNQNNTFAMAFQPNGILNIWGNNVFSTIATGAIVKPVQISAQSNWSQVCCGLNYAMAVQSNGVLWGWGNNSYGQLGLGDLTHRSSLTQVGTTSNWSRVACGYSHTAALQSNGTLWTWGLNSYGQLGQGNFTSSSTPIQVGTLSRYVTVYAMNYTTLAELQ